VAVIAFYGWETGGIDADYGEEAKTGIGVSGGLDVVTSEFHAGECSQLVKEIDVNPQYSAFGKSTVNDLRHSILGAGTWYYTVFFKPTALTTSGAQAILSVNREPGKDIKFEVRLNNSGTLQIYGSAGVQIGASSANSVNMNAWNRLDVKVGDGSTSVSTDGPYEVLLNNVSQFSGTAATHSTATSYVRIGIGTNRNSSSRSMIIYYDDLVICNTAFVGLNPRVWRMDPIGNGDESQWTEFPAATNKWADVDDWEDDTGGSDGDATYIFSTVCNDGPNGVSEWQEFTVDQPNDCGIPSGVAIDGVKLVGRLRTNSLGTGHQFHFLIRSGGTLVEQLDAVELGGNALSPSFVTYQFVLATDPTGGDWDRTKLETLQIGVGDYKYPEVHDTRCSAICAMVLTRDIPAIGIDFDQLNGLLEAADLTVVPGARSLAMNMLPIVGESQGVVVVPGAVSVAADTMAVLLVSQAVSVIPGAALVAMDALDLAAGPRSFLVVPGGVATALGALTLELEALPTSVVPGGVALLMDALAIQSAALTILVGSDFALVVMGALAMAAETHDLFVVPGAVLVPLQTVAIVTSAGIMDVQPGAVAVTLDALGLSLTPEQIAALISSTDQIILMGEVSIEILALTARRLGGRIRMPLHTTAKVPAEARFLKVRTEDEIIEVRAEKSNPGTLGD